MIHVPGVPRSGVEMLFVLEATPCPACGAHAGGDFDYKTGTSERGGVEGFILSACPSCGTVRELHFHEKHDIFAADPGAYELGGPEPSTVMDAGQLMAELDRVALLVPEDPPAAPAAAHDAIGRAITCLYELVKFFPPDADAAPPEAFSTESGRLDHKLRPTRYRRTWLEAQKKRYLALDKRYRASAVVPAAEPDPVTIGKLDSKALEAHLQWVRRRGDGPGQLVLRGLDAKGAKIGPKELSGAILIEVDFDGADLSFATLASAQLEQVSFKHAALASATLAGSRIADCRFDGAAMTLTKLGDAALEGCTFGDAELDRSTWYRAQVRRCDLRGAHLGNAALDRAVFVDCDLRGAELALRAPQPLGTTFFTRFERCDLRGTTWGGRNLARAELIDCKLGGASGRPELTGSTTIERADLSAAGDGNHLLDGDAALAALGWK